jgi:hypothetical protein
LELAAEVLQDLARHLFGQVLEALQPQRVKLLRAAALSRARE